METWMPGAGRQPGVPATNRHVSTAYVIVLLRGNSPEIGQLQYNGMTCGPGQGDGKSLFRQDQSLIGLNARSLNDRPTMGQGNPDVDFLAIGKAEMNKGFLA